MTLPALSLGSRQDKSTLVEAPRPPAEADQNNITKEFGDINYNFNDNDGYRHKLLNSSRRSMSQINL